MPIHLITGIPGHGKTARMMAHLLAQAEKADRPIFAAGIDGLAPGLATVLDNPIAWNDWEEAADGDCHCDASKVKDKDGNVVSHVRHNHTVVPDGAIVYVDEAWKWFGHLHDARGQKTPNHVLTLAEHRHRGIDFVWTSQGPSQIYPFARPLVGPHEHCVRRFGSPYSDVYQWGELVEDPKSQSSRDRSIKTTERIPKHTFGKYKSASAHTIKMRLPLRLYAIPIGLVLAAIFGVMGFKALSPDAMAAAALQKDLPKNNGAAPAAGSADGVSASAPGRSRSGMGPDEWLARWQPRLPGWHGSEPIFDGTREVRSQPQTFCVIRDGVDGEPLSGDCSCYTEQVTPLPDVPDGVCRQQARHGVYDPYRAPITDPRSSYEAEPPG